MLTLRNPVLGEFKGTPFLQGVSAPGLHINHPGHQTCRRLAPRTDHRISPNLVIASRTAAAPGREEGGSLSSVMFLFLLFNLSYWFAVSTGTKHHKPGGLEQQKFIVSQFWRPEVQIQGVSRAVVPRGLWGIRSQASLLASSGSLACDSLTLPPHDFIAF